MDPEHPEKDDFSSWSEDLQIVLNAIVSTEVPVVRSYNYIVCYGGCNDAMST